jgi:hypothetical protein
MAAINIARVISLPGLFFIISVTISLYSARKRNSCLWRSFISLPGKDFPRPGLLSKAGPSHSPIRSSIQRRNARRPGSNRGNHVMHWANQAINHDSISQMARRSD